MNVSEGRKHSVYGKAKLRNGIVVSWLQFKSGAMSHKEAERAAKETIRSTMPSDRVWVIPHPLDAPLCFACNANATPGARKIVSAINKERAAHTKYMKRLKGQLRSQSHIKYMKRLRGKR
jgi:hypothetical protein